MTAPRQRMAALAGMIGSALFVGVFTLEGWLRPGYHPLAMFVSALSLGPRGFIQIANFVVSGALLLGFSSCIARAFPDGKASRAGPKLFAIIALSLLMSGPFVMDPVGTPVSGLTVHGVLHQLFGSVVFSLMPVTCFVLLRRFRSDPSWRSFRWGTAAAGTIIVAGVILLKIAKVPNATPNAFNALAGLFQRTALVTYMGWVFSFASALYRREGIGSQSAAR